MGMHSRRRAILFSNLSTCWMWRAFNDDRYIPGVAAGEPLYSTEPGPLDAGEP